MKLSELKKMISEEYTRYMKEQDMPMDMDPMGGSAMPPMPGGDNPGIDVGPDDIDITSDKENPTETLRAIFDMLKDFFEGGDKPKAPSAPKDDKGEDDKPKSDKGGDKGGDKKDDKGGDKKDDDKEDKKEKEALQERFQKLANIIK